MITMTNATTRASRTGMDLIQYIGQKHPNTNSLWAEIMTITNTADMVRFYDAFVTYLKRDGMCNGETPEKAAMDNIYFAVTFAGGKEVRDRWIPVLNAINESEYMRQPFVESLRDRYERDD